MADVEDIEDPLPKLQEECKEHHCSSLQEKLTECSIRVQNSDGTIEETCVEEFFDLMECIDHCAAPKLFAHLK